MKLAESLEAAGEQDKFWEMHDRIINNIPHDIAELRIAAAEVGLDTDEFNDAIDTGEYTDIVLQAIDMATEHNVEYGTLFINGLEFTGNPDSFDSLKKALDRELERMEANDHA